jgi:hypothetical protein
MRDRRPNSVHQRRHPVDLSPRLFLIELDVAGSISSHNGVARMPAKDWMPCMSRLSPNDQLVHRLGLIGDGQVALAKIINWKAFIVRQLPRFRTNN